MNSKDVARRLGYQLNHSPSTLKSDNMTYLTHTPCKQKCNTFCFFLNILFLLCSTSSILKHKSSYFINAYILLCTLVYIMSKYTIKAMYVKKS